MTTNPGIEAVRRLAHLGYRFTVAGKTIKAKYHGPGDPDPAQVRPLLELARQHKEEVRYFLKSYCPRCGGACFIPDYEGRPLCMACDWDELVELYPDLKVKH
jgi:ribosomal protein S27AE